MDALENYDLPHRAIRLLCRQLELQLVPHTQPHTIPELRCPTLQLLLAHDWVHELRDPGWGVDWPGDGGPAVRLCVYVGDQAKSWYPGARDASAGHDTVRDHHVRGQHHRICWI